MRNSGLRSVIGKMSIVVMSLFLSMAAIGQGTIKGSVTDEKGEALIGATVAVDGTSKGTVTDISGNYSLSVDAGSTTLIITYVGFQQQTYSVSVADGDTKTANFSLKEGTQLDDVVVTGTRSKPRTTISSPVPIDNFSALTIDKTGNGDLTENIRNIIPSYSATPLTGDGSAFVRPTSLRGLPPDETLVMVNSKRRHRSALIAHFGAAMNVGAHASDIGQIPSLAIKNLEVLRDGAAAQYGSDAIAGVFNFILKDAREGVEVQSQIGKWYGGNYGSETDYKVAINFGLPLTKNGFLNITSEYQFNEELSRGVQHAAAVGVPGAQDPAMNWGRPESKGVRNIWNAGIEISDNVELYSFGNFSDTYGNYSFFYRAPGHSALRPVPNDPQDPSKGNFSWGDIFPAGFTPRLEGFQTDFSTITGLRGTLGGGVNYDVSASYGYNKIHYVLNGSLNPSWGPFSQTNFEPGDLSQQERNFNIDLSKELVENVNLAVGFQTRNETYTMFAGDYQSYAAGPWAEVGQLINPETGENYSAPPIGANGLAGNSPENTGEFEGKSWGAYADLEWDITEAWLLQLAFRHEDYVQFGTADNFKIASRYTVADWLTLRGGYSTGFRAPTPGQANVVTITTSFDGVTGTQVQEGTVSPTSPLAVSLGGKALVPETSENLSIGLASRLNESFSFTFDYFKINVDDRIIKSRSLPIVNPQFSELAFYTNSLNTETSGFDAVLSYELDNTTINLAYNRTETEVISQTQVGGQNPVSDGTIFNLENNLPKDRLSFSVNQDFGIISALIRANYYGKTIDERGDREEVGDETLVDVELTWPVSDQLRLVLGANNVFNNYPDEIDTRLSQGMPYPRRTPIGYNGGMVYFRVSYKF